jgi:chromosome segregation ATPase
MKPPLPSKKNLKKLEDSLKVERNRLNLMSKVKEKEGERDSTGDDESIEKWDDELELLTSKLRGLREKSPHVAEIGGLKVDLEDMQAQIESLSSELKSREIELDGFKKSWMDLQHKSSKKSKALETEVSELKSLLNTRVSEIKSLKRELDSSQRSLRDNMKSSKNDSNSLNKEKKRSALRTLNISWKRRERRSLC